MSNISVTTTQNIIDVTEVNGITVTTPTGQTITVEVPNSTVDVTNTTDEITVLTGGTLNIQTGGITSVNGNTGPVVVLDTDDISEGTTNKYFSQALARQSLSAGTGISYDNSTGVITNTSINTDTTYTQNASSTTGGANLNLVGSDSTTDTVKFASGTNITVSRTDANTITIDGTDLNTTYTIASSSTTGGANLTLTGSDSSTDSVAYKGAGATTVTSTDANTVTITSTDTNTTYTQNASATTGGANLNLVGSDSTTDSIKLASGTNVTVTRTDADTITISSTDTNTTYTQNASATAGGANLNLVGSDSTTDSVAYLGSGATTVTRTDDSTITISSTDTNTTYTQNISSTTGGANLNLVGSDSSTDTVKFANGTGVTVAYTDANTATVSIGQSVGTGDSPSFAGGTFGNITVGVATDNTITTTTGDLNLDSASGSINFDGNLIGYGAKLYTDYTRVYPDTVPLKIYKDGNGEVNNIQGWKSNGTYASPTTVVPNDGLFTFGNIAYTGTWDGITPSVGTATGWNFGPDFFAKNYTDITTDTISPLAEYGYSTVRSGWGFQVFQTPDSDSTSTIQDLTRWEMDGQRLKATVFDLGNYYTQVDSTPKITAVKANGDLVDFKFKTDGSFTATGNIIGAGATLGNISVGVDTDNTIASTDTNGNITLDPNGTGDVVLTFANGGNLINDRNYVFGAIRNSTTETNGDMWSLSSGASAGTRGISIDNSTTPSKRPGVITRAYSANTSTAPRSMAVTEIARGNPTSGLGAVQTTDRFCEMTGQGYNGTNWTGDVVLNNPFTFRAEATETWSDSPRRAGTKFLVFCQPKGVDYTTSSVSNIINHDPTNALYIADQFAFNTRTTASGGTNQVIMSMSPSLTIHKTDLFEIRDSSSNKLPSGKIDYRRTFGCFHKVANVTAAAANTVYEFDWYNDTTVHIGNQGVTVTSGQPTRVNIDAAGNYTAFVEMQIKNTVSANRVAWIWLAKNGTDLDETRIKVEIKQGGGTDAYQLINKLWLLDNIAANDYVEVRFAVDNTSGISLEYEAAQTSPFNMPAQPSATLTIVPVGA